MRLLKLGKLLAPVGLAIFALSMNPDSSQGQFPGGGGRDGGKRGRDGGGQPGGGYGGQQPGGFGGGQSGGGDGGRGGRGGFGGGNFGGGGGASSFADRQFTQLQASYGGSGDTLDYSRIPAATREQSNAMAQRFGGEPLPTSGTITLTQYRDAATKRMEARMQQRGGPMGTPAAPDATAGNSNGGYGGYGGPGGYGGRGGPGGDTPQSPLGMLARYDTDKDGRLSLQEAQSTDRLKTVFDQYDANRDGFIDAAEAQAYMTDRMNGGRGNNDPNSPGRDGRDQGGWNRDQPGWGRDQQGGWGGFGGDGRGQVPQEEPKPIVLRYGKLPKDLPAWFKQLDTDEDGQVGLYEWRRDGRKTEDFLPMDLNGDGLLTAEEYLRYKNPNFTLASLAPKTDRNDRGDRADRGDDRRAAGEDRGRGGNPFTGGGNSENTPKEEKKEEKKPSGLAALFGGGSRGEAAAKDKENKKDDKSRDRGNGGPGGRPGGGPGGRGRSN